MTKTAEPASPPAEAKATEPIDGKSVDETKAAPEEKAEEEKKTKVASPLVLLPTTRTPAVEALSEQTILIHGAEKIGKSTFAAGFPDALFFPTEPGLRNLEVYQVPADGSGIKSWEQFLLAMGVVFTKIQEGQFPFKTLVIDTVDNLWKLCCDYICKKRNVQTIGDLGHGKGWALAGMEFERVLRAAMQLRVGVVLISHTRERETETEGGVIVKAMPDLPNTARRVVMALVDMILFFVPMQVKRGEGEVPTEVRVIRTKPSPAYEAGDRTGKLPETILLNYDKFVEAYNKSVLAKS